MRVHAHTPLPLSLCRGSGPGEELDREGRAWDRGPDHAALPNQGVLGPRLPEVLTLSLGGRVWVQVMDDYSVIGRSLFKKETNIQLFVGLKVRLSTGELGVIDSAFGQSGKFKVHIPGECGHFLPLVGTMQGWWGQRPDNASWLGI